MGKVITGVVLLAAWMAIVAYGRADEPVQVDPVVSWSGTVADPDLQAKMPGYRVGVESGYAVVVNFQDFEALWKAWRPTEQVPKINFSAQFVFVGTLARGQTSILPAMVDSRGEAQITAAVLDRGKELPGFGYALALFSRDKIKSVGGKEIPAR